MSKDTSLSATNPNAMMLEEVVGNSNVLELDDVSKTFVGVRALSGASLHVRAGEVHALVGENGAGKSTLIKIAAGALVPNSGQVRINGELLDPPTVLKARRLGLLTAYQDLSLTPDLTVEENILLSLRASGELENHPRRSIRETLASYDVPFELEDLVSTLSPGARQLLEVVRAMIHRPRVLLLDEPTAALDAGNIRRLEALIDSARARGAAILYISHRLDEVKRLADRVTVIRDGMIQGTFQGGWKVEELVELMIGTRIDLTFPPKPGVEDGTPPRLMTRGFSGRGFGPVDVTVRRGEIVGIAGAEGNGQRELLRTLVGLTPGRGVVEIDGTAAAPRSPADAIARGIMFASGDREAESIFRELSVMHNTTLGAREKLGPLGSVMRSRQKQRFNSIAGRLGIVHASPYQPVAQLSGGNQQKAVLGRALLGHSAVLVVDEPTAGVDARARLDIYGVIRDQAALGQAVVVNSSDATELQGLCDRVYVVSRGRIVRELQGDDVVESKIVESFVNAGATRRERAARADGRVTSARSLHKVLGSDWVPLSVLMLLTVAIGAYATTQSDAFLTEPNLSSLLLGTMPLAVVALGQQVVLISGGFDMSIGSAMSLTVVIASFTITGATLIGSVPGIALCLALGLGIGLLNGVVVRLLGVSPIIATIATLGILSGAAVLLRPEPGGIVGSGLMDPLSTQIGFVPVAFFLVVLVGVCAEIWLRRSLSGLTFRATGLNEQSSRRTGVHVDRIKIGAYVACSVGAVLAGLLLAAQVGIGQNAVGVDFPLMAFTACFLGGAALTGGRGSFIGAILGALFLSTLVNITPLIGLPDATSRTVTGALTIIAVFGYVLNARGSRHAADPRGHDETLTPARGAR